jgi:DNA (cytosine-5)-methyltransferase 1
MTVNGQVFVLPMQERRTTDSESSSLATPRATDYKGGGANEATAYGWEQRGWSGPNLAEDVARLHVEAKLPTPQAMDTLPARSGEARERQLHRGGSNSRRTSSGNLREDILQVLPTPTSRDHKDGQAEHRRDGEVQTDTVARAVFSSGEIKLGTPRGSAANGPTAKQVAAGAPKARLEDQVESSAQGIIDWGKFEPAIKRWEQVIEREAPAPTKPDGKDGAHRLSSRFTEWMMGLPDGWITDVGLTRNEELKACGNGVVPQQAELALRVLLEGVELKEDRPR